MTRSMASSSSGCSITFLLRRAARMAASLTRFSRSAPTKPGVERASTRQVDVGSQRFALDMHFQDRFAAAHIGAVEHHPPVEATGAQQGRVEDVRAVGGSHDDDVGIGIEAVHLDQHLVEGLLALVVAAAQTGAALATDGIDFIHKDDAGRVALGLVEQVAHAAGADADEHLDKLRAGDGEEGHAGFAGDSLWRAGSCRCQEGRPAARPWECARPAEMNFSGSRKNSTTSCSSSLASSTPATSSKVTVGWSPVNMRARDLPNDMAALLLPCAWRKTNQKTPPG